MSESKSELTREPLFVDRMYLCKAPILYHGAEFVEVVLASDIEQENAALRAKVEALEQERDWFKKVNQELIDIGNRRADLTRILYEALKTIEAIMCDKPLCGHFTAEEIREVIQHALAQAMAISSPE